MNKFSGFPNFAGLFRSRQVTVHEGNNDEAPTAGPSKAVATVISDDEDEEAEPSTAKQPQRSSKSTNKAGRKGSKELTQAQQSGERSRQAGSSMTSKEASRPKATLIRAGESFADLAATTSTSTRQSANRVNGASKSAYALSNANPKKRNTSSPWQPGANNNFDGDKPGVRESKPVTLPPGSTAPGSSLPSFTKNNSVRSIVREHASPAATDRSTQNRPQGDPVHQYNSSGTSYAAAPQMLGAGEDGVDALTSAKARNGGPKQMTMVGRSGRSQQTASSTLAPKLAQTSLSGQARLDNLPQLTASGTNSEGIGLDLKFLKNNSTSTPSSKQTQGKGKASESSAVIELGDSEDDSIEDADGPLVTTTARTDGNHRKARMGSGTSAMKGLIPQDNTKNIISTYEKKAGNVLHERPPSNANGSPDSFSLDAPSQHRTSMVSAMKSKSNASSSVSTRLAAKQKPPIFHIPLRSLTTVEGASKPGAEVSSAKTIIRPDQIARIFAPAKVHDGSTLFLRVDVDNYADLSEALSPRSAFYFFEFGQLNRQDLIDRHEDLRDVINQIKRLNDEIEVQWVLPTHFEDLRRLALGEAEQCKRTAEQDRSSSRIKSGYTGTRSDRHVNQALLMNAKDHQHSIDDVPGEAVAPVVAASRARPKARPKAGLAKGSVGATDKTNAKTATSSRSPTLLDNSDDTDSSSDPDVVVASTKFGKNTKGGTAAQDFYSSRPAAGTKKHLDTADDSEPSNVAHGLPLHTDSNRRTRSFRAGPAEQMKGDFSSSDSDAPDPKKWSGRLEPEQETALVFPREGTGAVSVLNSDINRLAPGEFLNDTLIEYGMKRILHRISDANPSFGQQIHMFSSFFYKKLTTKDRKTGVDPYNSVRKWTSKVDIFEKKFIFVPINEYFHWYLAIIVNPGRVLKPALKAVKAPEHVQRKTRSSQEGIDVDEETVGKKITSSRYFPPANDCTTSDTPQQKQKDQRDDCMAVDGEDKLSLVDEDLTEPELPDSDMSRPNSPSGMKVDRTESRSTRRPSTESESTASTSISEGKLKHADKPVSDTALSGNEARLSAKVSELTLNTNRTPAQASDETVSEERCCIYTLDSLSGKHPSVITNLKNYLIKEAKDKKKLPEDAEVPLNEQGGVFSGMTAHVPQQPNMSDCGLYVLHFTEVFLDHIDTVLPALSKRTKRAPETTNATWHYEKAETKRDAFYKELLEESKQWKKWRKEKDKEAVNAEDDQTSLEEDDGEDIELVPQNPPAGPAKAKPKRKLRRHSDVSEATGSDSDSQAILVTSKKATPPPVIHNAAQASSGKAQDRVVVEIGSPSRKRAYVSALEPTHQASSVQVPSLAMADGMERRLASISIPSDLSNGMPRPSGFPPDSLQVEIQEMLRQHPSHTEAALSTDGRHATSAMLEDDPPAQHGAYSSPQSPRHGPASRNLSTSTSMDSNIEDSGSEDSDAQVTDDEAKKPDNAGHAPQRSSQKIATSPAYRRPDRAEKDDSIEDSFHPEMIRSIPNSQSTISAQHMQLDKQPSRGSSADFEPNTAMYTAIGQSTSAAAVPHSPSRLSATRTSTGLDEGQHGRKRLRSEGEHSPAKPERVVGPKRVRAEASVMPGSAYKPRRQISQDVDDPVMIIETPADTKRSAPAQEPRDDTAIALEAPILVREPRPYSQPRVHAATGIETPAETRQSAPSQEALDDAAITLQASIPAREPRPYRQTQVHNSIVIDSDDEVDETQRAHNSAAHTAARQKSADKDPLPFAPAHVATSQDKRKKSPKKDGPVKEKLGRLRESTWK